MLNPEVVQKIITAAALALFLLFSSLGYNSGKKQAQSRLVIANAHALKASLNYFYSDQDRYPSVVEFGDLNLMRMYSSAFPPKNLPAKNCPQNFRYQNSVPQNFTLSFCLPAAREGYVAGWNQLKQE